MDGTVGRDGRPNSGASSGVGEILVLDPEEPRLLVLQPEDQLVGIVRLEVAVGGEVARARLAVPDGGARQRGLHVVQVREPEDLRA